MGSGAKQGSLSLLRMDASEFVRRLRDATRDEEKRFAFFLGAGCSRGSGIPLARELVQDYWLPKLRDLVAPDHKDANVWAADELSDWDPDNPAGSYGEVIERLFRTLGERQCEIERICRDRPPSFGYAVLSGLMLVDGGPFNVVLTTNFDDLAEDAMVHFRSKRPLVIQHESLAPFIRPTRTRPIVVKLHGDHRLAPHNTAEETTQLHTMVSQRVAAVLHDRGLIVIGYGGNDESILRMFEQLPDEALPYGVYWVSGKSPRGMFRRWLECRRAVWVEHRGFDELMLLFRNAFNISHPDEADHRKILEDYRNTFQKLSEAIEKRPEPKDKSLTAAAEATRKSMPQAIGYAIMASWLCNRDPDKAEEYYKKACKVDPENAGILGSYAVFLSEVRKDSDQAEKFFKQAIEVDSKNINVLSNYALFLDNVRKDNGLAEEYYKLAIGVDPKCATALGNYAAFLWEKRKDNERAEEFFKRALEVDPKQANALGNYAAFLWEKRKDNERAEEFFKRALEVDPKQANALSNYAAFLWKERKDKEQAEELFKRALEVDPKHASALSNYAAFLLEERKNNERAEELFKQAIEADPKHANNLGNYAAFLWKERKDNKRAEELFKQAIEADPNHAMNLGNYAVFLAKERKDKEGAKEFYKRAIKTSIDNANTLGNYAQILFAEGQTDEGLACLLKAESLVDTGSHPDLDIEIAFYRYVHGPEMERAGALRKLKELLIAGSRSSGWDLSPNVERARKDGHPAEDWLDKLAAVITQGASMETLVDWDDWKQAG